jgi:hypothetical protein
MVQNKKLLKLDTPLKVGDVVMFRDRFKKTKYGIFQITKIIEDVHIDATCIAKSKDYYCTLGKSLYWSKVAHSKNQSTNCELTYILPVGKLLFNAQL